MSRQTHRPAPQRILVRGVNWIGDAIMTTPALARLRQCFPQAHISLLTHEKLAPLWQHSPSLDSIVTFSADESPWSIGRRLQADRPELGIILPGSHRSAIELWWGRVRERVGYARPWRNCFLTLAVRSRVDHIRVRKRSIKEIQRLAARDGQARSSVGSRAHHQMHDYLHLMAALGANPAPLPPSIHITPEEVQQAAETFGLQTGDRGWLGLNAGAEYGSAKRWPVERFISAAAGVQKATQCRCVIFGGAGDLRLAEELAKGLSNPSSAQEVTPVPINLAGKTSLRELCALLKLCRVLLTNDTGPMHLAAAVGTPVVTPFGSTSAELTGPGTPGDPRHRLIQSGVGCSPCFRRECPIDFRCMTSIEPQTVIGAVLQAWTTQ